MDEVREALAPLTDWIPDEARELLPVEAWWFIEFVALLVVLLILGRLYKAARRALRKPRPDVDWDQPLRVVLAELPAAPAPPAAGPELLLHHLPVRLRLVVLAPGGRDDDVDEGAVEELLDNMVPGLGAVARQDASAVRIWPAPLSQQAFLNTFHRAVLRPEREGALSRWSLLAGKALVGRQPVYLGIVLWAQTAHTLGRLNLAPQQWLEVLHFRQRGEKK